VGAEVWISVAIGALLLLMQPRLLQFLSHKLFGTFFSPYIDPNTGGEVPYTGQADFWSDLGITLFALVLILEGVAIALARKRGMIMAAFGLTVLTTAYNLGYLVTTFSSGGIALLSAFAVAFGVYIAIYEWNLLRATAPRA
jgi:lipopolysaccharide export LptBFGC system permease protein LptF